MMRRLLPVVVLLLVIWWASTAAFQVDETEFAMVTQFGRPVRTLLSAGLQFKLPAPMQTVLRFDSRLQVFETPAPDRPNDEFLTRDKKNIVVGTYTAWRIRPDAASLSRFLQTAGDTRRAQERMTDLVVAELGACLGRHDFSDLVTNDAKQWNWRGVLAEVLAGCKDRALHDYGISIEDIQIQRLSFPDQNRRSVFERMRSERERLATQYRSEGESQAVIIRQKARDDEARILADAETESRNIRGRAEAEATHIYGDAYGAAPDFYRYIRTLESYSKGLEQNAVIVFSGQGQYFDFLNPPASSQPFKPLPAITAPASAPVQQVRGDGRIER